MINLAQLGGSWALPLSRKPWPDLVLILNAEWQYQGESNSLGGESSIEAWLSSYLSTSPFWACSASYLTSECQFSHVQWRKWKYPPHRTTVRCCYGMYSMAPALKKCSINIPCWQCESLCSFLHRHNVCLGHAASFLQISVSLGIVVLN